MKDKKHIVIGILGAIICLVLFSSTFLIETSQPTIELAIKFATCLFASLTVGFILVIFFNWKAFTYGFTLTFILVIIELLQYLQNVFLLVVVGFPFYCILLIREFNKNRQHITSSINSNASNSTNNILEYNDKENNISYKSLFVIQNGILYQIIKSHNTYYFHKVGNTIVGFEEHLIIRNFENLENQLNKRDFKFDIFDINEIIITLKEEPVELNYGSLKFVTATNKKTFNLLNEIDEAELNYFFDNQATIINKRCNNNIEYDLSNDLSEEKASILNKINIALLIFSLFSTIILTINLIISNIALKIISIICVLIPYLAYLVFSEYLTLAEQEEITFKTSKKLTFISTITVSTILFTVGACFDVVNIIDYDFQNLLIISLIVFIGLLLLFLLAHRNQHKSKQTILVLIMLLIFFSPACVITLNNTFATFEKDIVCEIKQTYFEKANNNEITYIIEFNYNNQTCKKEVSHEDYLIYKEEKLITISKYNGLLGIDFTIQKS
ncbi:MAG: hypothetical protein IJZ29_03920 [Clostridia bacterium]|nr:hypothetical protein [Clostridia bacterium]